MPNWIIGAEQSQAVAVVGTGLAHQSVSSIVLPLQRIISEIPRYSHQPSAISHEGYSWVESSREDATKWMIHWLIHALAVSCLVTVIIVSASASRGRYLTNDNACKMWAIRILIRQQWTMLDQPSNRTQYQWEWQVNVRFHTLRTIQWMHRTTSIQFKNLKLASFYLGWSNKNDDGTVYWPCFITATSVFLVDWL